MKKKSLLDISWLVDEPTYRADPALSYSTLSRYQSLGFNDLDKLFDKLNTPSLSYGSAVDSIITGGLEEFNMQFMVADYPDCGEAIIKVVKKLFDLYNEIYNSLDKIPNADIITVTEEEEYQKNWKPETRARVIKEKGSEYYNLMYISLGKTILNTKEYADIQNSVSSLKNSNSTKFYFAPNNPFNDDIVRYYQLKFKATFNSIDYRCMADLIITDYDKKVIQPIDLKTSSDTEWDFYKAFIKWHYQIQARLYWRIIRNNLDRDSYFKDFKLLNYKFIVVNKRTLTPLVWDCDFTQEIGTLTFGKDNQIILPDPFDLGKELHYYLSHKPKLPIGIKENEGNDIRTWLNIL